MFQKLVHITALIAPIMVVVPKAVIEVEMDWNTNAIVGPKWMDQAL